MSVAQKVLFVDRDGTLIVEPDDEQVDSIDKLELVPGVIPALLALTSHGYRLVMVTNQDGLGTESFPRADFDGPQRRLLSLLASQGVEFDAVFVCPHLSDDRCDCRKPRAGLLTRYLAETAIDTERSAVIGDRESDMAFAANLGLRGYLLRADGEFDSRWEGICQAILTAPRAASVVRKTRETNIELRVELDSGGPTTVDTGIGFFDHMLEQIAKHGGFRLQLICAGDLEVDAHHTVEDVALCLGEALRGALGDKLGIGRYGFLLPMDESEARVSIDLSGRPFCVFEGDIPGDRVGGMPTEMVGHFFRSFADALRAAIHVDVRGENAHHMVEASFKSVGRALRQAIRREGSELPSTKGLLA